MKRRKVFNRNTVVIRGSQVWVYEVKPDKFVYCGRHTELNLGSSAADIERGSWEQWLYEWQMHAFVNSLDFVHLPERLGWRTRGRSAVFEFEDAQAFWTKARYYRTKAGQFVQDFESFFNRNRV